MKSGEGIEAAWAECPVCALNGVAQDERNQLRVGVMPDGSLMLSCPRCFYGAPFTDAMREKMQRAIKALVSSRRPS